MSFVAKEYLISVHIDKELLLCQQFLIKGIIIHFSYINATQFKKKCSKQKNIK